MPLAVVSAQRIIRADAAAIFDVLADPQQHALISGDGSVRRSHAGNPERLSLGARFGMDMKIGAPYRITNRVVEFEEGRRVAWRHFNGHVWRYLLEPGHGATTVREQWDPTHAKHQWFLRLSFRRRPVRRNLERTLERLAATVETPPVSGRGRHPAPA